MKTFNHTISFPSAVGELVVQYNFTPAEIGSFNLRIDGIVTDCKEHRHVAVEITSIQYHIADMPFGINPDIISKLYPNADNTLKQAVYTEHIRLLKEKEDREYWENRISELNTKTQPFANLKNEYLDNEDDDNISFGGVWDDAITDNE